MDNVIERNLKYICHLFPLFLFQCIKLLMCSCDFVIIYILIILLLDLAPQARWYNIQKFVLV